MTTPKPVKACKRWAYVDSDGCIQVLYRMTREDALEYMAPHELVRVLITPIPPKRKAKGKKR